MQDQGTRPRYDGCKWARSMRNLLASLVFLVGCGGGGGGPDAGGGPPDADPPDAWVDSPDADTTCAPRATSSDDARLAAAVDALEAFLAEHSIPGGAIAIITGSTTHLGVAGVKTTGGCAPIGFDTRFRLGLLAEVVTAAALLDAVEDGDLDTAAPVTSYIDLQLTAPADPDQITLDHLLVERSGIGPTDGCVDLATFAAAELPAWSPPGRVGRWDPRSYGLAGHVLASLGGSYAEQVQERVFDPLGMTGAIFSSAAAEAGDHADGHFLEQNGLRVQHADALGDCEVNYPSHAQFASITDAARLAHMMVNDGDGVVGVGSLDRMMVGSVASSLHSAGTQGYGFQGYGFTPAALAWQGSQSAGYGQDLQVALGRDIAVITLVNRQYDLTWELSRAILQIYQPDLAFDYSYTADPSGWGEYAGTWVDPIGVGAGPRTMVIAWDGSTLSGTLDGDTYAFAAADGDDMFDVTFGLQSSRLRFWRDSQDVADILSGSGPPFFRQ